jgi:hypothetical protein
LFDGNLVNRLSGLLRTLDKQVDIGVTGLLQAVLGSEACFQVNGAAGLKIDVNVATPSVVICARTVEVNASCRIKLAWLLSPRAG